MPKGGKYDDADGYDRIAAHVGHELEAVTYADGENAAIECLDCGEVVFDYDRQEGETGDS